MGNITDAIRLIRKQLAMYQSPRFYHDLATMLVMRTEVDASAASQVLVINP